MNLPDTMKCMMLVAQGEPLVPKTVSIPVPGPGQVLVKVLACGVCRTDLHVADGDLKQPKLPLIPGHEITGIIANNGPGATLHKTGDLVGIPWLGYTCGKCKYCLKGKENLCSNALFTGYTIDGGYAEYTVAFEQFCFPLTQKFTDPSMAPLLCAGLIGYRSWNMIGSDAVNIGFYGFGAAASILIQIANSQGKKIFAFSRPGDTESQSMAKRLGAHWAGDSSQASPVPLDAAILFAPAGELVPKALRDTDKGGIVICAGIHMSDIPSFPYSILWEERTIHSVANLTRKDAADFFSIIAPIPIHTETMLYHLYEANTALNDLRSGAIHGAAVLVMD